ncbi:MAG TPA: CaiB/BaiF CoA-transferase family protein [Caulobacteraceae bacterium]|jgi:crotonobetainyl-CoA:carnitine CoA-transferase CaiB-like acyl-CoA transferase
MAQPRSGPLAGVTVLDLSRVLAGPWATQLLADLGADVVKVERPGAGDDTRAWGPPFTTRADGSQGDAAYFFAANRNKRSITVDMAAPEGADLLRRLATRADVLVENFRTGALKKYGLDYDSLSAANPKLVYCSITGFGHTGPLKDRAGYDYMIQAMGGLMSITGQPEGAPGGEPMKVGVAVADLFTGLYASNAILAALLHARATGEGQHVDMALFDAQAAMLANQATNWFVSGEAPTRMGNAHPNLAPYQPFATGDGEIVIAVGADGQFRALCRGLGEEALADDDRFRTNADRVKNRAALVPILESRTRSLRTQQWIEIFDPLGVPCGPVNTVDRVFAEPQAQARELVVEQARADLDRPVRTVACPVRLSRTPPDYRAPPPSLGAHTEEVLQERLGLSEAEIARLRGDGVL